MICFINKMNPENILLINESNNNFIRKKNKSKHSNLFKSTKINKDLLSDNNKSINDLPSISTESCEKSKSNIFKIERQNNKPEDITNSKGKNPYFVIFHKTESFNENRCNNYLGRKRKLAFKDKMHLFKTQRIITPNNINNKEGRWSYAEQIKFIEGLVIYGKKWIHLEKYINTRTASQIRSHAQKFVRKLKSNEKFNLVFDKANIDNISDLIDFIKNKNLVFAHNMKLTIKILIDLAVKIPNEERKNQNYIIFTVKNIKKRHRKRDLKKTKKSGKLLIKQKENINTSNIEKLDNDIITDKIDSKIQVVINNKSNETNDLLLCNNICKEANINLNTKKNKQKNFTKIDYILGEQDNNISLFNTNSISRLNSIIDTDVALDNESHDFLDNLSSTKINNKISNQTYKSDIFRFINNYFS